MKKFIEDNWDQLLILSLIISVLIFSVNYINNSNKERLAIINNTKENVKKYEKCENIDNYYYCWNEK